MSISPRALGVLLVVAGAAAIPLLLRFGAVDPADLRVKIAPPVDLLERMPFALVESETREIRFGTAAAKAHYAEPDPRQHEAASGFLTLFESDAEAACAVAIGSEASVTFTLFRERSVRVTLDATGLPEDEKAQEVTVTLNGDPTPVTRFKLPASPTIQTFAFKLPATNMRRGHNRLHFHFATTVRRAFGSGEPFRYPMAAVFRRLAFELDDHATPETKAPGDITVDTFPDRGAPRLQRAFVFEEGTRVSVPVRLPDGRPIFKARVFVHPDDRVQDRDAMFRMRIVSAPGGRDLVVQTMLDARGAGDVRVPLDIDHDVSLFRNGVVSLQFESAPETAPKRPLRIVVADPRIEQGLIEPATATADEMIRTDELARKCARKNLVLITLDAAAASHFTAYGATLEYAPTIDGLARDGVVFEKTYTPASYTLAAMASLFTGSYPQTHGVLDVSKRLADSVPTLAALLAQKGYTTLALITNPNAGAAYGLARGFAFYDELNRDPKLWNEGVPATALAPRLAAHLTQDRLKAPFFLYVHVFQPHAPYRPPASFLAEPPRPPADGSRARIDAFRLHQDDAWKNDDFERLRELYRSNIRYADAGVKAVLDVLKEQKLLDDTMIVVVGDHGEAFGEHGTLEHGDTTHTEEVHVPFIVRLPPSIPSKPMRVAGNHSLVDVAPTLLGLLAGNAGALGANGVDCSPQIAGALTVERSVFQLSLGPKPQFAIRYLECSFIADLRTRAEHLYGLVNDAHELSPIEDEQEAMAEYLRAELDQFLGSHATVAAPGVADTDLAKQASEIGYVSTGAAAHVPGSSKSPLARRVLTIPAK